MFLLMLSISRAAQYLGISMSTLRRWDKAHRIIAFRPLGNQRRYTQFQLDTYLGTLSEESPINLSSPRQRIPYIYARVSSYRQNTDGNLERQIDHLIDFIHSRFGIRTPYKIIKEYGSGLNPLRKGLQQLLKDAESGKVSHLIISFKDRLTRFGYPSLEKLFHLFHVDILEAEARGEVPIEEQLTEDMMTLLASFSGKFYKSRSLPSQESNQKREDQFISKTIQLYLTRFETKLISCLIDQSLNHTNHVYN
jgi:excisionase family DNA binding protein